MRKNTGPHGPSLTEIKLKADLDRTRRDLSRLKKSIENGPAPDAPASAVAPPAGPDANGSNGNGGAAEPSTLEDLRRDRQRLAALYATQLREHPRRSQKLREILESIRQL